MANTKVLLVVSVVTTVIILGYVYDRQSLDQSTLNHAHLVPDVDWRKAAPSSAILPISSNRAIRLHMKNKVQALDRRQQCQFKFHLPTKDTTGAFHKVGEVGYVHTAYYDGRKAAKHRILAVGFAEEGSYALQCILWFNERECTSGPATASSYP